MRDETWEQLWERQDVYLDDPEPRSPPDPGYEKRLEVLEQENIRLHNGLITLRDRLQALEERESERPAREGAQERRRQGRRGRWMGFLAGVALAWVATALVCGGLLLGWKVIEWTAGLLDISPLLMIGLMLLLILGSLLLRESKSVADWFLEDDDPWDDEDED